MVAIVALLTIAGNANAAPGTKYGYVCRVIYEPISNAYTSGLYGKIGYTLYSEANCTGSYLGQGYLYSEGMTNQTYLSHSSYLYSEASLLALYQRMVQAADVGQRVRVVGSTNYQTYWVSFYGN